MCVKKEFKVRNIFGSQQTQYKWNFWWNKQEISRTIKNMVAEKIKMLAFEFLLKKKDKLDKVRHIKFEN